MKFFTSEMPGGPVMNGTAGSMLALLDACLKDGFGIKSVTSLTVTDGIATAVFSGASAAVLGSTILVSGVTDKTALNGEQKVLSVTGTQVTFATGATNGAAAGTISFKIAPLGWGKPFSGTNVGVYRATAPEATGFYLRVDDTAGPTCRVLGYESMTDSANGMGRFPTDTQVSGGMYWSKSNSGDAGARTWALFGDDQFFAIYVKPSDSFNPNYGGSLFGFGDIVSLKPGDAYGCTLFGATTSDVATSGYYRGGDLGYAGDIADTGPHGFVARASTGIGGAQAIRKHSSYLASQSGTANSGVLTYPNTADNGLLVTRVDLRAGTGFRGYLPGVFHTPQYLGDTLPTFTTIEGTGEFTGRTLMVVKPGMTASASSGPTFIDITGPWR